MNVLRKYFPQKDQDILENALLLHEDNVDLAINYILDFFPQNNEEGLDAVQGMLDLSTIRHSTLNNSIDVIDLSNVPE
eukprot:11872203-Ditylum_brightwellii.AAC.1